MPMPIKPLILETLDALSGVRATWPAWLAARRGDGVAPWPCLHVSLDLTYRCNLRCDMCFLYGRHLDGQDPRAVERATLRELSAQQWCALIAELARSGVSSLVMTGGEVMLKRGFFDILACAVSLGLSVSILTNGTLFDEAAAYRLLQIGPDLVRFSLDGDGPTHDAICRRPTFARLTRTLGWLAAARRAPGGGRKPRLAFETILQRANQQRIASVVHVAADFGVEDVLVSNIFFTPAQHVGAERGQTTRAVEPELYDVDPPVASAELELARTVAAARGVRLVSRLRSAGDIAAIYRDPHFAFIDKCFYPWLVARVDPYGRIIACTGSRLPLGNATEQPFGAIWNGPAYRTFRRELGAARLYPECAKCNTLAGSRWVCWNWFPPACRKGDAA